MSALTNKSDINYSSAEILQQKSHYCSTVHCAYYSSVQLMKHILLNNIGKSESQIKTESKGTNGGSHIYMIAEVFAYLIKINNKESNMFNTNIVSLKKLRERADYFDVNIDSATGKSSITLAESINKILKKVI